MAGERSRQNAGQSDRTALAAISSDARRIKQEAEAICRETRLFRASVWIGGTGFLNDFRQA